MRLSPSPRSQAAVPFVDLAPTNAPLKARLLEELAALIDRNAYVNGPEVARFEAAFAAQAGTAHCVGVSSGLDALRFALVASGLEPGDEVIVPANTFVATFAAVVQAGGHPLPVDASESDYNIDVRAIPDAVTPRTRFVLPVHLYGQLADMSAVTEIARRHDLVVIEDACQAHGAERDGVRPATAGAAAGFSFYPSKNLGAMGDAGAVVTDEEAIAERVRMLREHGQRGRYDHEIAGYTGRLDTVQALVLLAKLPYLDEWTRQRRAIAASYSERLRDVGDLRLPPVPAGSRPVWHLYETATGRAEELAAFLRERGISTGRHYPTPPHLSARPAGWRRLSTACGTQA